MQTVRRVVLQPGQRLIDIRGHLAIIARSAPGVGGTHECREQPSRRRERLGAAVCCMPVVDTERKVRGNTSGSHQSSCASSAAAARIAGFPSTPRTEPSQVRFAT